MKLKSLKAEILEFSVNLKTIDNLKIQNNLIFITITNLHYEF